MKIVILHPPLYPVNHKLFNELGKYCELHVICFGNHPVYHNKWKSIDFLKDSKNYELVILEGKTDLNKLAVTYKLQFSTVYIKYIYNLKPDYVISVAFWIPSFISSLFKYLLAYKFLVITDTTIHRESSISFFRKITRKIIVYNSDYLLSGSKLTKSYLKTLTKSHSKIKNSYQVIDVNKWRFDFNSLPNKKELREKYCFGNEDKILLTVGRLDENKNISSILKQLSCLPNFKLIIVGDGPLKNMLIESVSILKLTGQVYFFGQKFDSELIECFKMSDVFVFPTLMDTFGFVVAEALATGLPVICSEFAGASSLIEDGFNGYTIDPTKEYKDEINQIFNKLEKFSKNAFESVTSYTIEKKAYDIYKTLKSSN